MLDLPILLDFVDVKFVFFLSIEYYYFRFRYFNGIIYYRLRISLSRYRYSIDCLIPMVRYMTMKRITQILASVLFVITVLTVYLAFDFALSTAASQRIHSHKRAAHQNEDEHLHAATKITRKRSATLLIPHLADKQHQLSKNSNVHEDPDGNQKRVISNPKSQLRARPGSFHKGKTGVKANKPLKGQQKRVSPAAIVSQRKDKPHN